MKKLYSLITILSLGLLVVSCKKEDPVIPNEEEMITTLTYTLTSTTGGETVVLEFQDLDGDGGDAPVIQGGTLAANHQYNGELSLLNEAESPAEDITAEVMEEALEHQFFFQSATSNVTVGYADMDTDGNPIGISSVLNTGDAASGNLTIILRHEPMKSATGVSGGDIANAGGETDIEVTFPLNVQ